MIGNIVILGLAICIIWYVVKVFRSNLIGKPLYMLSVIGLLLILVFSICLPNIEFIKSPLTPTIHCKVIDAETNNPIIKAMVILDWGYEISNFPYHNEGVSTKQQIIMTNSNGEFSAERKLRCLAINLFIIYKRDSGGVGANVIYNGYKHAEVNFNKPQSQLILMEKLKSISDRRVERSNLFTIKEMSKKRYKKDIAEHIGQTLDSISRQLYLQGV